MPKKLSATILLCAMLSACATPATRTIVDTSCTAFKAISFAVPSAVKPETADNRYDTPATVDEIMAHNARWDRLCASE
ncbi:hypothetical protein AI27_13990 [Sphingomonas sp. BHC-A]|nr:hypothetical protein AI27_13990 [Sphingomonas sp. BHC-A]